MGKEDKEGEPSSAWKKKILRSEHSPIRLISITAEWENLPYFVSVHIVRHHVGIEHWVSTQRTDRTGVDRGALRQDAPVTHRIEVNFQALINISKVRLCNCASPETRKAWSMLAYEVGKLMPEVGDMLVPSCVYRGYCPEFKPCGYSTTQAFQDTLEEYRQ